MTTPLPPPPDKSQAAKDFEAVINQAPKGSSEYKLYSGKGKPPTVQALEYRIDYLKNRAPHLSLEYKEAAIAYLHEELKRLLAAQ